uniref:Glutathione S-transferase 1, isoform C n=1 Tax=Parasteatoda tepidariorum TaxID=114398 RepID=A0A2L2XZX2_PARTP
MVLVLYMMEISPPCRAVLMTIKYLGIQAELREENIVIGNPQKHQEFLKINPRSCVPTIDDDGFYLWESRAIMTYLVNKYSPSNAIYPKDAKKRAVVDMMLNFDQVSLDISRRIPGHRQRDKLQAFSTIPGSVPGEKSIRCWQTFNIS